MTKPIWLLVFLVAVLDVLDFLRDPWRGVQAVAIASVVLAAYVVVRGRSKT